MNFKNSKLSAYLGKDIDILEVEENYELRHWYSPSKRSLILIETMDTIYINNCINMLNGKGKTKPTQEMLKNLDKYIGWFEEELEKRSKMKI